MNIQTIDLNLLRVFMVLFEKRNVSLAGKSMGLSQPAVSHALQRLRVEFKDQLFIRNPRGLTATPRALEIGPFVHHFFQELEHKLSPKAFNALEDAGTFKIKGTDYFEQTILPSFIGLTREKAPLLNVISQSVSGVLPKQELEQGHCDLAVAGFFGELPNGFYQQKLFQDKLVGVARKNHPYFKSPGLKEYLKHPHLVVSGEGKLEAQVDRVLTSEKKKRNVVMSVSGFMPAGWIIKDSDLLIALPERLANQLQLVLPLMTFQLPVKLKSIEVIQVWHEIYHQNQRHQWMRKNLFEVCQLQ